MPRIGVRLDDVETPKPVPAGSYAVKVTKCESRKAKNSNTEMLAFTYTITEQGELQGRTLIDQSVYFIDPDVEDAEEKTKTSWSFLKEKLEALKFKWDSDGFDPNDIVGSQAIASVTVDMYEGREVNRIQRLMPLKRKK